MDDLIRYPSEIKRRRRYTREFKDQILAECADPNVSTAEVARRHGINNNMIYNWRAARKAAGPDSFVQLPVIPPSPNTKTNLARENTETAITFEFPISTGVIRARWPVDAIDQSVPWLKALMQ